MSLVEDRLYITEDYKCEDCEVPYPHLHVLPMEAVIQFDSCDTWHKDCILDTLERKRNDVSMIDTLLDLIVEEGFKAGYGIAVDNIHNTRYGYIHDGHHRLTVLYDLGVKWCPVQTSARHGMDTPEYKNGKNRRYRARYGVDYPW